MISLRHQLSQLYLLLNYALIMHRNIGKKYMNENSVQLLYTSIKSGQLVSKSKADESNYCKML